MSNLWGGGCLPEMAIEMIGDKMDSLAKKHPIQIRIWNKTLKQFICEDVDIFDLILDSSKSLELSSICAQESIYQYSTGIYDIDSKKIYEGDLIVFDRFKEKDSFGVIEYDAPKWVIKDIKYQELLILNHYSTQIYNIKIVGHKYDGILRGYRVIGPAILDNRRVLNIDVN